MVAGGMQQPSSLGVPVPKCGLSLLSPHRLERWLWSAHTSAQRTEPRARVVPGQVVRMTQKAQKARVEAALLELPVPGPSVSIRELRSWAWTEVMQSPTARGAAMAREGWLVGQPLRPEPIER